MSGKELYIKRCMNAEGCSREDAENFYELSMELQSDNFTKERGIEIVHEMEALRNKVKEGSNNA